MSKIEGSNELNNEDVFNLFLLRIILPSSLFILVISNDCTIPSFARMPGR